MASECRYIPVFVNDVFYAFGLYCLADNILAHMSEMGRKPPIFEEAAFIAEQVLDSGYEFDVGEICYNKFK